jgi:putative heme-binding domain-containing protein
LLQAVRDARIAPLEIPPGTRSELQRLSDSELRRAFIELLKNAAGADRGEVVQRFTPALKLDGDQKRGAEVFSRSCLICHTMKGRGVQVGPDLSSVGTRPKETLLVDVLDPSRAVSQDSLSYTIETIDGEIVTGLITAETATQITIRRAQQPDETIPRPRIKTIKADGKSLMPDGLEQGWSELDCADLLEFLRKPDANLLPESK